MLKGIITIKDHDTGRIDVFPMHSFVGNFVAMFAKGYMMTVYANFSGHPKKTTGSSYDQALCKFNKITVGDNNTALSPTDINLNNEITCTRGSLIFTDLYDDGVKRCFDISQSLENTSGNSFDLKEIGGTCYYSGSYYLLTRDVLETPISWAAGATKTITLTFITQAPFLDNFLLLLLRRLKDVSVMMKRTSGSNYESSLAAWTVAAADSNTSYGILIGSGTTAFSFSDYKPETQLTSNWLHSACAKKSTSLSTETGITETTIQRDFLNNTGSAVDVSEVCIVITDGSNNFFCIARKVFTPVSVANNQTFRVTSKLYSITESNEKEEQQS